MTTPPSPHESPFGPAGGQPRQQPVPGYQSAPPRAGRGAPPNGPSRPPLIQRYQAPKSRTPAVITTVVLLLVAGLVYAGSLLVARPGAPAASPSRQATPATTAPRPGAATPVNGIPVHSETDNADAYWEITRSQWAPEGLILTMRLTGQKGTLKFSVFALDNTTAQDYQPEPAPYGTFLGSGRVEAGGTVEGTVLFGKDRRTTTVILADDYGYQITALQVDG